MDGLFRQVLDRTAQAIFVSLATTGKAVDVNQTGLDWLGYTREEFLTIGVPGVQACPEGPHLDWEQEVAELRASENAITIPNAELRRKDGSTLMATIDVRLHEVDGVEYVVGVARDITEERRTQDNLRLTQLAVDSATIAMFRVSPDAQILAVNRAGCSHLGYTEDEIVGMRIFEFDPDYGPSVWPEHWQEIREKKHLQIETTHRKKDGTVFPVEISINYIPPGRFNEEHCCSFIRDLSHPRELEKQLRLADRMTSIGTLAAGVAHEINNPLQYVMLSLELLRRSIRVTQELGGLLGDAEEGCRRIRDIVADLQSLSRTEEGERGPISVHDALDFALKLARTHFRHCAKLRQERTPKTPYVESIRGQLGQVLLNIIINAAQAFEQISPSNEIVARTRIEGDDHVIIEISDNGVGIAPKHLSRVYDAFFTTKARGVGTGLGLAISHSILTSIGGDMTIESELGRGTTVTLRLPTVAPPIDSPSAPIALRAGRVLIVDDDIRVAKAFARHLTELEVETSSDGHEALRLLTEHDYDVVLCDVMIPELSGPEIYRQAVAQDAKWAPRFIFISGGACTRDTQAFIENTDCQCLAKPVCTDELRRVVAAHVAQG